MRAFVISLLLSAALAASAPAQKAAAVRVWQGTLQLPTYAEGPANPNPPFDLFTFGRFNYPYPIRDGLTDRRENVAWRSLHLENEYLRLTVLPDLGGHIYSCLDKRSGREMFYANTAIKKALIGYRGAWAAFGVEFNFPVSHNWMSMSPVDFATAEHADGSASIHVGNIDQVYGSQWRVELRLAPGRAVLDQDVELYNPGDSRHRYYWWSNAAVQAWDDSRLVYPTEAMTSHGFTAIERWPVDEKGRDLSIIRNQTSGPVSLFTHATREEFVGVYHPRTRSGTVHVAARSELPTHKVWSWGNDREAAFWRTALSDDDSGYVELQAGLFRNQETYAFLEPQETVRFTEHWLPVRDLGGITRANVDAVLHMDRPSPSRVRLALDVTREVPGARITVGGGVSRVVTPGTLSAKEVWRAELDAPSAQPVTFELADADGRIVLSHTENEFDRTPAKDIGFGPTAVARASAGRGPADVLEAGTNHELEGRRLKALDTYRAAIEQHGQSADLLSAAGRMATTLGWPDAGGDASSRAVAWLQAAHARNTTDVETEYYLGVALAAAGRAHEARRHLESAHRFERTRAAAGLQLARLSAMDGDLASALRRLQTITRGSKRAWLAGALEAATLRRLQRRTDAVATARQWRTVDPTNSLLRYELTLNGEADPALWEHLAADANRVLDLVDQYLAIGDARAALGLLDRTYPAIASPPREPGAVPPGESPMVAYYRGFVRERLGESGTNDDQRARSMKTTHVFPARKSSFAVLRAALKNKPDDATAQFLLGSRHLASGLTDEAIAAWQRARALRREIPTLHRNLALALLHGRADFEAARAVLAEGIAADPENVDVYLSLDAVLSAEDVPPRQRADALQRFPDAARMPASLVFRLALALAEAGETAKAEPLFRNRFFPREEGGTNVRAVYAQVQIASARAAADAGRCGEALRVLEARAREREDLPFTKGGLADAYQSPQMAGQIAGIESACGRRADAVAAWARLARPLGTATAPVSLAMAAHAERRLERPLNAAVRRRIETAVDDARRALDAGSASSPGTLEYARGLLLGSLGRSEEARQALRRVFLYPDRGLSHALAR